MPQPKNEKEIQGFLVQVQYISRFIAKLTIICESIFKKLRASDHTDSDNDCQKAFGRIMEILSKPHVLMPPQQGIPLSIYLTVIGATMEAMLAQTIDGEELAIYYISKKFIEY
ncbi:uncharacterized protein LOC141613683 [Silene latifolia]|uniref:uncharacterized protein LOC141613683 n=1 Tax=Silene latifolia TaxID=37657 RepID=UPI003D78AD2E